MTLYYFAGGAMAASIFFGVGMVFPSGTGRIASFSIAAGNMLAAFLEAFATQQYLHTVWLCATMQAVSIGIFIVLLYGLGIRPQLRREASRQAAA